MRRKIKGREEKEHNEEEKSVRLYNSFHLLKAIHPSIHPQAPILFTEAGEKKPQRNGALLNMTAVIFPYMDHAALAT